MQAATANVFETATPVPVFVERPKSEALLLKEHDRLIKHVARAFAGCGIPVEDLAQEARLVFVSCIRSFDSAFGATLWTYAFKRVVGALQRMAADESARTNSRSDEERADGEASRAPSADVLHDAARISTLGMSALDETERKIVTMHVVDEMRISSEIAPELGLTPAQADYIYRKAIAKLRNFAEVSP